MSQAEARATAFRASIRVAWPRKVTVMTNPWLCHNVTCSTAGKGRECGTNPLARTHCTAVSQLHAQ